VPIVLVVEYDGTEFHGFARQPGQRTVAGVLTDAVARIEGQNLELFGAGRTDSGVHARGQTVHFESRLPIPPARWRKVLNRSLPRDLQVRSARKEPDGFHARFSATSRVYRYTWLCRAYASPFATRFAYHEPKTLDAERMNEAAQVFLGEHDFRALAKAEAWKGPTCRGILSAGVRRVGPHVRFDVEGTGFMQGMVRMMAGALSEVGLGRWCIEEVRRLLNEPMAARRPPMLPAHGLCLMKVNYAQTGREAAVATNKWTDEEDE